MKYLKKFNIINENVSDIRSYVDDLVIPFEDMQFCKINISENEFYITITIEPKSKLSLESLSEYFEELSILIEKISNLNFGCEIKNASKDKIEIMLQNQNEFSVDDCFKLSKTWRNKRSDFTDGIKTLFSKFNGVQISIRRGLLTINLTNPPSDIKSVDKKINRTFSAHLTNGDLDGRSTSFYYDYFEPHEYSLNLDYNNKSAQKILNILYDFFKKHN